MQQNKSGIELIVTDKRDVWKFGLSAAWTLAVLLKTDKTKRTRSWSTRQLCLLVFGL